MRRIKVIINYSHLTVLELIEIARNSAIRMATNENVFITPDVAFSIMNLTTDNLEKAYHSAQGGDKQKISEMNQLRKALEELLRKQAQFAVA